MGNPALEEFFGTPDTLTRLGNALQQASTGLQEVRGILDARVSGLVPVSWDGQVATAFQEHWRERSDGISHAAQLANQMSSAMMTLGGELRSAKSLFQSAEEQAAANRLYITPAFIVLPYSWTDLGADAAMGWVQAEVWSAVGMAVAARAQAWVEIGVLLLPGGLGLLKSFTQGIVEGLGELVQLAGSLVNLGARLSPSRQLLDPEGYSKDVTAVGTGLLHTAQDLGAKAWNVLKITAELSPERLDADPEGFQRDAAAYGEQVKKALSDPDGIARWVGKQVPTAIVAVLTGGGGAAAETTMTTVGKDVGETALTSVGRELGEGAAGTIGRELGEGTAGTVGRELGEEGADLGRILTNDTAGQYAARVPPIDGYYDVTLHGDPQGFFMKTNSFTGDIDHRTLAKLIETDPNWDGGPIRLLSCSTGQGMDSVAQDLANKLGVDVMAPNDTLWVFRNGNMTIGPTATSNTGQWVIFKPGG